MLCVKICTIYFFLLFLCMLKNIDLYTDKAKKLSFLYFYNRENFLKIENFRKVVLKWTPAIFIFKLPTLFKYFSIP